MWQIVRANGGFPAGLSRTAHRHTAPCQRVKMLLVCKQKNMASFAFVSEKKRNIDLPFPHEPLYPPSSIPSPTPPPPPPPSALCHDITEAVVNLQHQMGRAWGPPYSTLTQWTYVNTHSLPLALRLSPFLTLSQTQAPSETAKVTTSNYELDF